MDNQKLFTYTLNKIDSNFIYFSYRLGDENYFLLTDYLTSSNKKVFMYTANTETFYKYILPAKNIKTDRLNNKTLPNLQEELKGMDIFVLSFLIVNESIFEHLYNTAKQNKIKLIVYNSIIRPTINNYYFDKIIIETKDDLKRLKRKYTLNKLKNMNNIYKGCKVYDKELELYGHVVECDNLKEVQIEFIGGGNGTYNLDVTTDNHDYSLKIIK